MKLIFDRWHSALLSVSLGVTLLLTGCAEPQPYDLGRSRTAMFGDNTIRYGSMAAGGGAGYLLGDTLSGGDPFITGTSTAAGVGLMYAANKYSDKKRMDAFNAGRVAGAQEAREELLVEKWRREAIYGLPPDDMAYNSIYPYRQPYGGGTAPTVRNVYAPTRTINGVTMQGGYQQVMLP